MHSFAIFASTLALASTTLAQAGVTINNHCSAPIYAWVVGDSTSDMATIDSGSNFFSHYQSRASGGVSMKLKWTTDLYDTEPVAQVEYTANDALWYDLSLINGDPFESEGTVITPQGSVDNSCNVIDCSAGIVSCLAAYLAPNDVATHSCPSGTSLVVDLCKSSKSKRASHVARAFQA